MDQAEDDLQHSSVARRGRGRSGKQLNKNFNARPVSGTCNVCSAPCSSCMHHNQTASVMESNTEGGSSEESSFANSVVQHPCKGRSLNDQQHTVSEVSNLHSTSSSHDSYSENAESKANARVPDIKSEDVDMPLKQSCLVDDGKGEVLGKMLDQGPAGRKFLSPSQSEIPMRQTDGTSAMSLDVDNAEEKATGDDAADLVTGDAHSKANSLSESFCRIAQSSVKITKNDTGKETSNNSSGELPSDNLNQQTESAGNSLKVPEARVDNENNESDILDDDVKVCDICGDVGREELLAICTRCSDGAEHTYCMRIMLDKLPEGDWLCEECKIKDEAEKKKKNKSGVSKDVSSALLSNLDSKLPATVLANKGPQNSQATGKKSSVSIGTSLEPSARTKEIADPDGPSSRTMDNSKPSLVREASTKITASKIKCGNITPRLQNQPAASSVIHASAPNSSKAQARHLSPRGVSLTSPRNNLKPKVEKVMDALKPKAKLPTESSIIDAKKERVQSIGRSTSFRGQNTGFSSADSIGKTQPINRVDAQTMLLAKQKGTMERKNSFSLDKSQSNSPACALANMTTLKLDQRGARPEGRVEKVSIIRAPEDAHGSVGTNEARKQLPCTPKAAGILPSSGQPNSKDQKGALIVQKEDISLNSAAGDKACDIAIQQGSSQSEQCAGQDDKNKEISYSRPPSTSAGRSLRCQRCNEMGHLTQFCSVDKFRLSAMKPYSERIPKDGNKSEKWRSAVEAAMLKTRMQRNNGLPGQPNEFSLSSNGLSRETSSKDVHSNLNVPGRNSSALEGSKQAISSDTPQRVDDVPASRESGLTSSSGGPQSKAIVRNLLPQQAFQHPTSLSVSAIPELECVWQGCFEVQRNGRFSDKCAGIQAHLSSIASPKVVDVAARFPGIIQLVEVSCVSAWPSQFRRKSPMEENIALFFFATDIESYEKSYKRLLENMLTNDLALKGNLDGVELLIFPSNKLPEKSQRWNRLFFLWGVFRANKSDCPVPSNGLQKKLCEDSWDAQNFAQDSQHSLIAEASKKFVAKACEQFDVELSAYKKAVKSENGLCNADDSTSDKNSSHQNGLVSGKQLTRVNTIVEQASTLDESGQQIIASGNKRLCGERIDEAVCQKRPTQNLSRGDVESSSFQTSGMEVRSCEVRVAVSAGLVTLPESGEIAQAQSSISHGSFAEGSTGKVKTEMNVKPETISISSQAIGREASSYDPRPNLKRSCASSLERVASMSAVGTSPLEEQGHIPQDNRRESKRIKLVVDDHCLNDRDENEDHRFSSKIHPVQGSLLDEAREGSAACNEKVLPECSTSSKRSEMVFFPVNCEAQQSSFISFPVASPAGEDAMETDSPNLDLALGAKRKLPRGDHQGEEGLPQLFLPLAGRGSKEAKPPDPLVDNGDDGPASLSLSLAFPFPEERQEVLPKRAQRNTSLLLFGSRFTDS